MRGHREENVHKGACSQIAHINGEKGRAKNSSKDAHASVMCVHTTYSPRYKVFYHDY